MKIKYIANDGTIFDSNDECQQYERELEKWKETRKQFYAERDDILLTFDAEKIEWFYAKYKDFLMLPCLPPAQMIYCDAMRTILRMPRATPEQRERARTCLAEIKRKSIERLEREE